MLNFTLVGDESSTLQADLLIDACEFFINDGMICRLTHLSHTERSLLRAFSAKETRVYQSEWVENSRVADGYYTFCVQGVKKDAKAKLDQLTASLLHLVECDSDELKIIIMKMMGHLLDDMSQFILCAYDDYQATPDGNIIEVYGEGGDQIKIAHHLGIKVVNVNHPKHRRWLHKQIALQEA